jgi:hypothetical protein
MLLLGSREGAMKECYICKRKFATSNGLGLHHENYHAPKKLVFDPNDITEDHLIEYERRRRDEMMGLTELINGLPSKGQS